MTCRLSVRLLRIFVLLSSLLCTLNSFALDDGTWTYDITGDTAEVTGCVGTCPTVLVIPETTDSYSVTSIGRYAFSASQLTSVTIPDNVTSLGVRSFYNNQLTSVVIGNKVISIGFGAFESNQLTSVTVPNNVEDIGDYAFYNNQLNSVSIGNGVVNIGVYAFRFNQLTNLTIPDSVTRIGDSAFEHNQLTILTIGNSVSSIGAFAFSSNQLTSVIIPDSVTSIAKWAFEENQITNLIIPDNVTSIGDYAFWNNQLSGVIIGNSVTSIGKSAFSSNQLTNVIIGNSVTSIEGYAFYGNQLTSVIIGNNVNSIGDGAFERNQLTSVIIPDNVTSIGHRAFEGNQLTSLNIGSSVVSIGAFAFSDNQLTSVTIPDSVISFGGYVFSDNQLTTVVIGNNVTSIGNHAFKYNQLTSVTIPDSVTRIEGGAFSDNELISVIIGNNVTHIENSAFENNQLTSVFLGNSVTHIENSAFENNQLTIVIIPDNVTNILGRAFASNQLNKVTISKNVKNIGNDAFYANQLTSVVIGNNVNSIGDGAFSDNQLTSVTIPDSVTSIGNDAFYANQLSSIIIGNNVNSVGDGAFSDNQLTSVTIPDSVTSIGNDAFYANQLSSIIIGNSVNSIGNRAFSDNQLTSVTIPDNVNIIGNGAFWGNQLSSVIIGSRVTYIGQAAFTSSDLTTVQFLGDRPTMEPWALYSDLLNTINYCSDTNGWPGESIENISPINDCDSDGIVDTDDAFPLDASEFLDSDFDGLGNNADTDDDGDNILDSFDVYPLISIGYLLDTNNNGAPDECDTDCIALGMAADSDDDNDGIADTDDAFSLIAISDLTDTDIDGAPDECDADCLVLGMAADSDDDNDGLPDSYEIAHGLNPLLSEDASLDFDNDGLSNLGEFLAQSDPHNIDSDLDGILDGEDSAPLDNTQGDTLAPIFAELMPLTIEALAALTDVNMYLPAVSDNSGQAPLVISDHITALPLGEYPVIWTASDNQGNSSTREQTVNIVDTTAPEFEATTTIALAATGEHTDISSALNIVAFDAVDGEVKAQLAGTSVFESGLHQIEVTVSDASGNQATSLLELAIQPLTQLGIDIIGEPGATVYLQLSLSGKPASYPMTVDYTMEGGLSESGSFSIENGEMLNIPIDIPDNAIDGDNILLTLDNVENAVLGEKLVATIHVQQSNVGPIVDILMEQQGKRVAVVDVTAGDVTVSAIVRDINRQDEHSIEWTESELGVFTGQNIILDATNLSPGSHRLNATATETNTSELRSAQNSLSFVVSAQLAELGTSDTDGDGTADSVEGYGDNDGDGIPDFKDNNSNVAQLPLGQETILAETGISLSVGSVAQLLYQGLPDGAEIDARSLSDMFGADLVKNTGFSAINDIVNFKATGLATTGGSVSIILPMSGGKALPANAVYRKFSIASGWFTFVADAENSIASAKRTGIDCPIPGSLVYLEGLNEGDDCIELTLIDGGIYDFDGDANGSIEDPGVIAVVNQAPVISIIAADSLQEGEQITLDAAGSTDPENEALTYDWQVLEGPLLIIGESASTEVTVQADDVQSDSNAVIELIVNDGTNTVSQQFALSVVFVNELPTVLLSASADSADEGSIVTLTGTGSDPDGQELTYSFAQLSAGNAASITGSDDSAMVELPEVSQTSDVVFKVTVTDSSGGTASDDVTISVRNVAATPNPPTNSARNDSGGGGSLYNLLLLAALISCWRAVYAPRRDNRSKDIFNKLD